MVTKLETALSLLAISLVAFMVWTWHSQRVGAEKCIAGDAKAVSTEVTKNATAEGAASVIVGQEAKTRENAIAAPTGPVATLGVQPVSKPLHCRPAVPAAATGPVVEADPLEFIRITGPSGNLRRDIDTANRRLVQIADEGDATIAALWDYAIRVCPRPK